MIHSTQGLIGCKWCAIHATFVGPLPGQVGFWVTDPDPGQFAEFFGPSGLLGVVNVTAPSSAAPFFVGYEDPSGISRVELHSAQQFGVGLDDFQFANRVGPLALVVNSSVDAVDINPGDGTCASTTGECTLRAAIMEANAVPGWDSIDVPAGTYVLTIPGTGEDASATGDLDITDDLSLSGAGMDLTVIDANQLDTVISANIGGLFFPPFRTASPSVFLSDFSVVNGQAAANTDAGGLSLGAVSLDHVRVADSTGPLAGGISAENLLLTDSVVEGNVGGSAGGIYNAFTSRIERSAIVGNVGSNTGGILDGGLLLLTRDSLIADNIGANFGGGMGLGGNFAYLVNTTISGNRASQGGGIHVGTDPAHIFFSTISNNIATSEGGGILFPPSGNISALLRGVLISGNHAPVWPDCFFSPEPPGGSNILSLGYNVVGIGDDCPELDQATDKKGTALVPLDARIGSLDDNGGPTLSHLPGIGSPVLDAVPIAECDLRFPPDGPDNQLVPIIPLAPLDQDQRGVARPQRIACDIGAVELGAPTYSPISGKRIALSDNSSRPDRRRLNVRSRDGSIATPAPGSAADPTTAGALFQAFNPTTAEYESTFLPPSHWKGLGSPSGSRGYRYRDADLDDGPCRVVTLVTGKRLSAFCQRDQLDLTLDEPTQGSLAVTLEFADRAYCMEFGGNVRSDFGHGGDGNGRFSARDAPAPAACPLP